MPIPRSLGKISHFVGIVPTDIFDAPAERLIARGRVVLCTLSMLALHLEPTPPTGYAVVIYITLIFYCLFAGLLIAWTSWRIPTFVESQFIHTADIAFMSIFMFLIEGPTSPIFASFTFVLLAATLRWDWQGVVITVAILALLLLIAGIIEVLDPARADNDLNKRLINGAYLVTAGGMLAFVSALREHNRGRLARLADWPAHQFPKGNLPTLATALAQAAAILEAPRVLVLWEEAEEPYVNVAQWQSGTFRQARKIAGTYGTLVHRDLASSAFLTESAERAFLLGHHGPARLSGLFDDELREDFSIRSVATAPFTGTICSGRVFILDRSSWNDADLLLSEIIASRTGVELDRQALQLQSEEGAAIRERIRLTRDLHDGVLQSLTAASLQLKLSNAAASHEVYSRLEIVMQLLTKEQRRIREFVEGTALKEISKGDVILGRDLRQLLSETAQHWDCATSLSVAPADMKVSRALRVHLSLMLAEAVANAVRHGGASNIDVAIEKDQNHLVVNVRDNGRGFGGPFVRYDHKELVASGFGPVSLRERVGELGGSLTISNSSMGAELEIRVPVS